MKNGIMEHLKRQEGPQEVLQWSWMWISVNLLLIFYLWMWECAMAWPVPHVCPSSVAGLHGISYLSPRCIRVEPATALTHHLQNCHCETRLIFPDGPLPMLTCNSSTWQSVIISGPSWVERHMHFVPKSWHMCNRNSVQILEWWPTKLVTENILNWLNEASALLCTLNGYNMSGWYLVLWQGGGQVWQLGGGRRNLGRGRRLICIAGCSSAHLVWIPPPPRHTVSLSCQHPCRPHRRPFSSALCFDMSYFGLVKNISSLDWVCQLYVKIRLGCKNYPIWETPQLDGRSSHVVQPSPAQPSPALWSYTPEVNQNNINALLWLFSLQSIKL